MEENFDTKPTEKARIGQFGSQQLVTLLMGERSDNCKLMARDKTVREERLHAKGIERTKYKRKEKQQENESYDEGRTPKCEE